MSNNSSAAGISKASKCPCGSLLKYIKCCGQYIKLGGSPLDAEALMRSRYTAYVLGNEGYLLNSWHDSTRPSELDFEIGTTEWLKLDIIASHAGKSQDTNGTVEFIAYFKERNQHQKLHEVSQFIKQDGIWYYLDGQLK